ncbi:MAG: acyl-CoA thioesterase [Pseudorhodoplanes sp.]|nr:4-hydroxybenzoyl-CoA thioesterase [Pseudorhodoplanes sp.]MBW7950622.1 acyl-CoA thioesterase [Pseudorhodoplanes sp.]MCL4710183.1 acyl-CoA thioesterase [Pseudorhodoplanes sp.]MCZ7643425.1 acyl-CoA thioesterase [Pseudorhodoplanes sp.]GIK79876.1 MAG: 4-hydroxybenzoyl-CoA thioesterase [Alphaproteobacteria bacterium]
MLKNSRILRIEWGDCDPAGIVFYPRYFAMFDHSTTTLISVASGLNKFELLKKYGMAGYPMVDTRARFLVPTRFGDDVTIESQFTKIGMSSFDIVHRLSRAGTLCVEGFETRVWVGHDPQDPSRIKSRPIPDDLAAKFRAG